MKHPHREIAARAGLSLATVDRVLHHRGGVRESTVREVHEAIAALDRSPLPVRAFTIDLVVPDPARVAAALDAELPGLLPAVIHPRVHPAADPVTALARVTGSDGLILEAPETPELLEAVGRLDLPVVALGTDLPASKRVAYVGLDQTEAGATAAYLVDQWLADRAGDVLVIPAGAPDSRIAGFRTELRSRAPNRRVLLVTDPTRLRAELAGNPSVRAVYTAARGHTGAVLAAFAAEHRNYDVFVAHDLDDENAGLLRAGRLSAVLHHDLRSDLRSACLAVLQALGAVPGPVQSAPAGVRILTPLHLPPF